MRVIVTRPAAQAADFARQLRALGLQTLELPLIEIAQSPDAHALRRAWAELPEYALAMFVSAHAVQHFFARKPPAAAWPPQTLAGASGPGTSAALRAAGVPEHCLQQPGPAGPFDTDTLWQQCLAQRPWAGRRVLLLRGQSGRDWLAQTLRSAGAQVDCVVAYRRLPPAPAAAFMASVDAALQEPRGHVWHFSSSESITNLGAACPQARWAQAAALATHARIAAAARALGFGRVDLIGWRAQDVAAALADRGPG